MCFTSAAGIGIVASLDERATAEYKIPTPIFIITDLSRNTMGKIMKIEVKKFPVDQTNEWQNEYGKIIIQEKR